MAGVRKIEKDYITLSQIERRFRLIVGARWEDRDELEETAKEQDRIRKRLSKRMMGKTGVETIREWRDKRC
ncbi:hypothetical protein KKG61_09680 [bacterium]|nr:hypothetical protein [bacterium]MBU1600353.1 hypothetical protein [bacterium]MBU2462391.1 hypothetical protein [bacterium]